MLLCSTSLAAQTARPTKNDVLHKFGFTEHLITTKDDTVHFYLHLPEKGQASKLVLYLQGSSPDPLFSVEKEDGEFKSYRWFPGDYKLLDEQYGYAVIAKSGIPSISGLAVRADLSKYHRLNYLDHRVFQADTVIDFIHQQLLPNLEEIIVYGHSEGAPVAAKLGTINQEITHLGFWAGNALPDFYDFILFNSKRVWSGEMSQEEALKNINTLFEGFREIAENPESTEAESRDDYSNKRWWTYAEPPINNLLKIKIPLFVQVAAKDESAPVESTYLIPLEFTRLGKTNLTFEICADCDHGFSVEQENGEFEDRWSEIFQKFISWVGKN